MSLSFFEIINPQIIILDQFQEQKQIIRNRAIVKEKLYFINLLSILTFNISLILLIVMIEFTTIGIQHASILCFLMTSSIFILSRSQAILEGIKRNKERRIVQNLAIVQISVFILSIIHIVQFLIILLQLETDIEFDEIKITSFMFSHLLGGVFFSYTILSNKIKFLIQIIYQIIIAQQTQYKFDQIGSQIQQIIEIHSQLLLVIFQNLIQNLVLSKTQIEQSERMETSYQTMHDLRNYVQSYIELMNNNSANLKPVDEAPIYSNPIKIKMKKINSKISAQLSKDLSVQNEIRNSNSNSIISQNNNMLKVEFKKEIPDINKILNPEMNEEQLEIQQQQRFIIQKICYLQHLELIQEDGQNLDPQKIDILGLVVESCEIMKILFQNKDNTIKFFLKAQEEFVILDRTVFTQFITDVAKLFHDLGYKNLSFQMLVKSNEFITEVSLALKLDYLNSDTFQIVENKMILDKLIHTLNPEAIINLSQLKDRIRWLITIPNPIEIIEDKLETSHMSSNNHHGRKNSKSISDISRNTKINKSKSSAHSKKQGKNYSRKMSQGSSYIYEKSFVEKALVYNEVIVVKLSTNEETFNNDVNNIISKIDNVDITSVSKNQTSNNTDLLSSSYQFNKIKGVEHSKSINSKTNSINVKDQDNKSQNDNNIELEAVNPQIEDNIKTPSIINPTELTKENMKRFSFLNSEFNSDRKNSSMKSSNLNINFMSKRKPSNLKSRRDTIQHLLEKNTHINVAMNDNIIVVNVDDEDNILKMNKRIVGKEGHTLNLCRNSSEFINFLTQVQIDQENARKQHGNENTSTGGHQIQPSILALMDHMLDREQGHEIVETAKEVNLALQLDITFVLLSSTEDKETLSKYHNIEVSQNVCKPLNKSKFNALFQAFKIATKPIEFIDIEAN